MAALEEAEELLKQWNKGIKRGARAKAEKELGISKGKMTAYLKGWQNPSEETIKKMASIFGKSEKEIRRLFCTPKYDTSYYQTNIKSKGSIQQIINAAKVELLEEKMKTIEAKIDLIVQLLKGNKNLC